MSDVQFEGSQCLCEHARHQHDLSDGDGKYPCDRCGCTEFSFMRERTKETRTRSRTGGEKGVKLERFDLIPVEALQEVARVYGFGAEKYSEHNWRLGYEWSKSYAAMLRHANQFWAGENDDEETGLSHLASVIFHAMALMVFVEEQAEYDDRFIRHKKVDPSRAMKDINVKQIINELYGKTVI